ncbi:Uncharacterised protein [Achromobacter insolitus]|nr:hypothetical protein BUW96_09540 [Achromobacter insolitus]OWT58747.1 hypothetical protein CEY08_18770 [Achromobacter insolitus]CAB3716374.1 hypothetical protein LMG6003_03519 [Achromobacter insolitus]VEG67740.1 Uncharacterised protein [Achromobacter insolitus]
MRSQPSRDDLLLALRKTRCAYDLDTAMSIPALAIALTNTAEALARRRAAPIRDQLKRYLGRADWRSIAANDD